jgi:NAD(P)-dependent dehydrogenase (short-subunit alcohol dehydrogenase family)
LRHEFVTSVIENMSYSNGSSQSSRFAGRVGIVTGASSGMGRGIALNLAREGATVVCSDLRPEANPKGWEEDVHIPTHEVITNNGGTAIFVKADVSSTAEIENLFAEALKVYHSGFD